MPLEIININWSQISWNDLTILTSIIKSNVIEMLTYTIAIKSKLKLKLRNRDKFMKIFKSYNKNNYIEIIIKIRNPESYYKQNLSVRCL